MNTETNDTQPDNTAGTSWQERLKSVQRFVAQNGRLPIQGSSDDEEADLARWVSGQRRLLELTPGVDAEQEQIRLLESIPGWRWDLSAPLKFTERLNQVREFSETAGRIPHHTGKDTNERILASWVINQRRKYAEGILSDEQKDSIESIPNWSWSPER
jgi:Helicase associated domain